MDHHVPRAITAGLRLRGIDVITAYEDGATDLEDPDLLDRAYELRRVLFTQDDDLLIEANTGQLGDRPEPLPMFLEVDLASAPTGSSGAQWSANRRGFTLREPKLAAVWGP